MLRITIAETPTNKSGRWRANSFPRGFRTEIYLDETETARRERKCVVDLSGVTFIDKNGEEVLAELCSKARNSSRPVFTPARRAQHREKKIEFVSCKELPVAIAR